MIEKPKHKKNFFSSIVQLFGCKNKEKKKTCLKYPFRT